MPCQDRLGTLQVRVGGHDDAALLICKFNEGLLEIFDFRNKQVDGVVVVSPGRAGATLAPLIASRMPLVAVDRKLTGVASDAVLVDNAAAARMAVEHLAERGHRRIAMIAGPRRVYTARGRLRGYRQAMKALGVPADDMMVVDGNYTVEGGYRAMGALCGGEATAIFATNYEMTLGAVIAIHEHGIRVPRDLSIVGFDSLELAQVCNPPLTMVVQPTAEIGRRAARLLLRRIEGDWADFPSTIWLTTELRDGASVADINA